MSKENEIVIEEGEHVAAGVDAFPEAVGAEENRVAAGAHLAREFGPERQAERLATVLGRWTGTVAGAAARTALGA